MSKNDKDPTAVGNPTPSAPIESELPPTGTFPSQGKALPIPHENDAPAAADNAPRKVMEQAYKDLANGLVDTDMRATPGLDAQRREALVPGQGGRSLQSPAGIDEQDHDATANKA